MNLGSAQQAHPKFVPGRAEAGPAVGLRADHRALSRPAALPIPQVYSGSLFHSHSIQPHESGPSKGQAVPLEEQYAPHGERFTTLLTPHPGLPQLRHPSASISSREEQQPGTVSPGSPPPPSIFAFEGKLNAKAVWSLLLPHFPAWHRSFGRCHQMGQQKSPTREVPAVSHRQFPSYKNLGRINST